LNIHDISAANGLRRQRALQRPAVFREPGALLYAGNCNDLLKASLAGKVALNAWTRRSYPGKDLGEALPQDWGLKLHCNEGVKIAYLARGSLTLTLDGQKHELGAGDMFVVRPWQLHAFGDPHVVASHIIWVLFDVGVRRPHEQWYWPDWLAWTEQDRKRLTLFLSRNEQPFYRASREVARAFGDIDEIVQTGDIEGQETRLRLNISMMLLQFMSQLQSQAAGLDSTLTSSKRTVRIFLSRLEHALDEDWTLENMAAECNLSRTQFSQHCVALTNMSPVRYLQSIRLAAARRKLAAGHGTVTRIAHECGFSSSQYFATCYRRQFGTKPTETPPLQGEAEPETRFVRAE
jgi:AraC family transcriptional regulator, L-rhamnose operon regulatory protein RhaS